MIGTKENPGICFNAVKTLIESVKGDSENQYSLVLSYIEVYNEMIRDLLNPSAGYLELRDDPNKGIQVAGISEFPVGSKEEIMNHLFRGNRNRTTEATNANQTSSRSHAVLQIQVTSCPKTKNTEYSTLCGKLSLIDLAGSERGSATDNRGIRLREGAKINRSLLALANCINALGEKSKKAYFIPFRDSKLTRLLKDSLGGNSKTVMIANISPSSSQIEETLNTLKWASRAKRIKTKVLANKKLVEVHIAEYKRIITELRSEIESLKRNGNSGGDSCLYCSRLNSDREKAKVLKESIKELFKERKELRRMALEIDESQEYFEMELKKDSANPVLKTQLQELEAKKEESMQLLTGNFSRLRHLREKIRRVIKDDLVRENLELFLENRLLELQNIELEISNALQEKMLDPQKDDFLEIGSEIEKEIEESLNNKQGLEAISEEGFQKESQHKLPPRKKFSAKVREFSGKSRNLSKRELVSEDGHSSHMKQQRDFSLPLIVNDSKTHEERKNDVDLNTSRSKETSVLEEKAESSFGGESRVPFHNSEQTAAIQTKKRLFTLQRKSQRKELFC